MPFPEFRLLLIDRMEMEEILEVEGVEIINEKEPEKEEPREL